MGHESKPVLAGMLILLTACAPNEAWLIVAVTAFNVILAADTARANLPRPASLYCEQQRNLPAHVLGSGGPNRAALLVGNLCNDVSTLQAGTLKFELYTAVEVIGAPAIILILTMRREFPRMRTELEGYP